MKPNHDGLPDDPFLDEKIKRPEAAQSAGPAAVTLDLTYSEGLEPQFMRPPGTRKPIEIELSSQQQPHKISKTVEYCSPVFGTWRRPNARMSVEGHKWVGHLLKSVLFQTLKRPGVWRRVDAIRCELDSWVECEYNRDELSDEVFFNLYYKTLTNDEPLATPPIGRDRHIDALTEVGATLAHFYPDCPPLRTLLRKANFAIASLRAWK